ncbi:glycoside hydrolase domain-containing protein [Actinoplanes sp. L3-i22]|uniref:glycoside hydrolase domain-containing protein n=1 Tax=Actinoplanes sp. L3-i22 TaxID=2836373 RepID=UPI0021031353|nr:glycoside hydrolase domain-containing protein [Actinoplanes sp. L3-i22]
MSSRWFVQYRKRLAGLVVLVLSLTPLAFMNTAGAATALAPQPGNFTGYGFDACTAPSSATMATWLKSSPYRAAGIYIGGVSRGCAQPNLTAAWVKEQIDRGWHLIPLYVGPQASCTKVTKKTLIVNASAASQGVTAATDAVVQAKSLGLSPNSVLIYDMEAYDSSDATCQAGVVAFLGAWTNRLHALGYASGFYSSAGSGIADQVAVYNKSGYSRPDYIDFARWDNKATVDDTAIPATYWAGHRRMKQYQGGHTETYGGVTINIDTDYLDFRVMPATKQGDWNRNGWSDVLAKTKSSSKLYSFAGNGTVVSSTATLIGSFSGYDQIVRMDLNRDGIQDIIARQKSTGAVYFYPGKSTGKLGTRKLLYKDMRSLREFTAIGDFNKDGYPDLLAQQISNGYLYLYPGAKGAKFGTRKVVAKGNWNNRSEFVGVGDFNRDGYQDLVVKVTSTGALSLYKGKSGGFQTSVRIGSGSGLRDFVGIGDFDRDGYPDLLAVQTSTGGLWLYRGKGTGLNPGIRVANGYAGRTQLF